jgi:hypothetical protein
MTLYSNFLKRNQRNVLINGNFNSWPAGNSFTDSGHTAAMTLHGFSTTGAFTAAYSSSSKPNDNCNYVHKVTTDTAIASPTGNYHSHTIIRVEGYDFLPFVGRTATLSFWVRATVTGTYSVAFRNSISDRSYVETYTINQSNTWEYKTITLKFDYSGGTWDYHSGIGIGISFTQMCGTTYATSTTGEWVAGNYISSTSQVNNAITAGNTFQISQCQLELGNVATKFEHVDAAMLSRILQRYYQSIYLSHKFATSVGNGTGIGYFNIKLTRRMRVAPTVTSSDVSLWNPGQGWKTATSVNNNNISYERFIGIVYDNTYAGFEGWWPLLVAGSWFFDARI